MMERKTKTKILCTKQGQKSSLIKLVFFLMVEVSLNNQMRHQAKLETNQEKA